MPSAAGFVLHWCEPCFDPALQCSPVEEPILPLAPFLLLDTNTPRDKARRIRGMGVVCHCAEGQGSRTPRKTPQTPSQFFFQQTEAPYTTPGLEHGETEV